MPRLSQVDIERFLSEPRLVRLATTDPDGSPLVVPLSYLYRARRILLTARERDGWLSNIRRDPRVCLCVDESRYPLAKVTIRGRAEIVFEPGRDDEWRELRLPLADATTRTPGNDDAENHEEWSFDAAYRLMTRDEPRALVAVALDGSSVTSWRLPVEGELLEGVWPARYYGEPPRRFRVTRSSPRVGEVRVVAE